MTAHQIEKFDAFLTEKMNLEEQKNFEQELESDEAFTNAFNTYRAIETHMLNAKRYVGEASLKSSLTKLGDEFFKTESKTNTDNQKEELIVNAPTFSHTSTKRSFRLINIPIWRIAAAILFGIVIIGTWYVLSNKKNAKDQVVIIPATSPDSAGRPKNSVDTGLQTPTSPNLVKQDTGSDAKPNIKLPGKLTNEKLFAEHFQPDAAPTNQEGPLEDAFDQYEKRQFTKAAAAFESADLNDLTRSEGTDTLLTKFYASYYQALSYIAIKKDSKALQLLKDLTGPIPILHAKVQWYLALVYLRTGDLPKAISILQEMDGNSEAGVYRLKANKLEIELKKGMAHFKKNYLYRKDDQ